MWVEVVILKPGVLTTSSPGEVVPGPGDGPGPEPGDVPGLKDDKQFCKEILSQGAISKC